MEKTVQKFHLTAAHLRWIALGAMLLDHLWAMVVPGSQWMTYAGRIAFPIFAFQIAEGARFPALRPAAAGLRLRLGDPL